MKILSFLDQNIDFFRLDLSRHYLQIDCDFTCFIVLNPSGNIPKGGTDICALHIGAWQIDSWKFLTKDFAQVPGFSACLVWDKTLVTETVKAPQVAESDIDTANSISSLKGQPVNITGFSMADNESLPIETREGSYIDVRSFYSPSEHSSIRFGTSHCLREIKVGDVFNSDSIEFLKKNALVEDFDDGIIVYPYGFNCVALSGTRKQYFSCLGSLGSYGEKLNNSYTSMNGGFYKPEIKVYINDDVVNRLHLVTVFSGNGVSYTAGSSTGLVSTVYEVDLDIASDSSIYLIF